MRGLRTIQCFGIYLLFAGAAVAAPCTSAGGPPVIEAPLPGPPFAAIASADGCTIYVSVGGREKGIVGVLRRDTGELKRGPAIEMTPAPWGLALTHDGKLLVAATETGAAFIDTERNELLGSIDDGGKGGIYAALTPDDSLAFIADERSQSVSVIDVAKARSAGFTKDALIGSIHVGQAPVGLAVTPDGKTLFATAETVQMSGRPAVCNDERGGARQHPMGMIIAIDVAHARLDPNNSVAGWADAGCNPVRVVLSPTGDRAYVTARGSDALLVFDTAKLRVRTSAPQSLIATVPVGKSPVGLAASADRIYVTNSDRFGAGRSESQKLSVVDATKVDQGVAAVLGTIPAGAFPRNLALLPDGSLLVTNAGSKSVAVIDLARVKPTATN